MRALIWIRVLFRLFGAVFGGLGAWYIVAHMIAKSTGAVSPLSAAWIALSTTACRDVFDELFVLVRDRGETTRVCDLLAHTASEVARRSACAIPYPQLTELSARESLRPRMQHADASQWHARLLRALNSLREYNCTTYEGISPVDAKEFVNALEGLSTCLRS